jgi:carbon monoxide dehydrogenase subunit G
MKLEQSFEVNAPLERVWNALIDVERVAPCLPGAEVTGRNEDGSYNGTFRVKIGPTAAAYSGKLQMDEIDESSHTATMNAQGTDRRGQGGAKATIVSSVKAAGEDSTLVEVATDYHITGRLARFGRGGMIEEISNRLLNEFAKSLQTMVAEDQAAAPGAEAAAPEAAAPEAPAEAAAPEAPAPAPPEVEAPAPEAAAPEAAAPEAPAEAELAAVVPEAAPDSEPGEASAPPPTPPAAATPPAATPLPATPPAAAPPPRPAAPESEPIQGLSLVGSVLVSRIKKNPAPFAALLVGFLLALRILRRRR